MTFNDLQTKFSVNVQDWNAALQIVSQCQQISFPVQPIQVQPKARAIRYDTPVVTVPTETRRFQSAPL